jgi:Oxidoreductase molybdopterin binding domain
MSEAFSRRKLITTGLAAAAGAAGLGVAVRLADRYSLIPPDNGGIYGAGEIMTYAAQRLLTRHTFAREYTRSDVSRVAPVKGEPPENETYERLAAGGFADWRLKIDGLVARPSFFSLDELKQFPSENHVFHQACEEGWSFIAEWTGVPLSYVLDLVGVLPQAKYVVFFGFDTNFDAADKSTIKGKWNSIDSRRLASANLARLWHERPGTSSRARRSASRAHPPPTGRQEHEISLLDHAHGHRKGYRQRMGSRRRRAGLFLVRRHLTGPRAQRNISVS